MLRPRISSRSARCWPRPRVRCRLTPFSTLWSEAILPWPASEAISACSVLPEPAMSMSRPPAPSSMLKPAEAREQVFQRQLVHLRFQLDGGLGAAAVGDEAGAAGAAEQRGLLEVGDEAAAVEREAEVGGAEVELVEPDAGGLQREVRIDHAQRRQVDRGGGPSRLARQRACRQERPRPRRKA